MTPSFLSPDDLPPKHTADLDAMMQRQLEMATSRYFFEACDGSTQSLLMACEWTIQIAEVLMLVIRCPDQVTNWRVLGRMVAIAHHLSQFSPQAKIRVYPPSGMGVPFDMRVDERSEYRDQS